MSQFMRRLILVALAVHVGSTQGLLVIGPQRIRSNQEYKMVITNFNTSTVHLGVRMEGYKDDGLKIINLYKDVLVRGNMNKPVDFQLPNLVPGNYKITMDGQRGFRFHKEVELEFISKSISGLIQLDKPVYKPGDSVHFRVIVLDTELKPPANVKSVNVAIKDSRGNAIRKWPTGRLHVGVFEANLEIAPAPLLGIWNISVKVGGEELVSKTFEVKEYVLATFDVDVFPTIVPLLEHGGLNLTISAKNMFGQPVSGTVKLTLFATYSPLNVKATHQVDGMAQFAMRFDRALEMYEESEEVNLNFTFTEQYTNRSIAKSLEFTVYKIKYTAKLIKEIPRFLPEKVFRATVKVEHRNGSPARSVNCNVEVFGSLEEFYDKQFVTDENGEIPLQLKPWNDSLSIKVSVGEESILEEYIEEEQNTEAFLQIAPGKKSDVQTSESISLRVICRGRVKFLVYYVLSKGNVIHQDFIRSAKSTFDLKFKYSDKMVPMAKVLVATVIKNTVVYDIKEIVSPDLLNNFEMSLEDDEVKPGEQIELKMLGRPESYVALAAYDKSLHQYGSTHDLYLSDVHQVYASFHQIEDDEYDVFKSNGLFARISDNLGFDDAFGISREGSRNGNVQKRFPVRTNFAESFLWRNVTLDRSGRFTLLDYAPNTTTAWCLTGFSVHPKYGLGIVKNPLQLDTVKAFYIVDHLPYSIKQDEVAVLQFTIFNNLGADYETVVTLENVQEQFEFVEASPDEKVQIQTILVNQTAPARLSFMVKAKKLGELVVRVKAENILEMDDVKKIIRVMPKTLVETKCETRPFISSHYWNQTFHFLANINKRVDAGSIKITFSIEPSLLSGVRENLENLIEVPTGSGESNMINVVPHVAVLDYLTAINPTHRGIEKTKQLLRAGYKNQLTYRLEDGSFKDFEGTKSSIFLTAFVAKSMQTAAKYLPEIEEWMVNQSYEWLAKKQHASGRFEEDGPILQQHLQTAARKSIGLTSFVLIAFLENPNTNVTYSNVIQQGIAYVSNHSNEIEDLFDLAIATYALSLHDAKSNVAVMLTDKLIKKSAILFTANNIELYWPRETHSIETTAYALLAIVKAEHLLHNAVLIMRWLVNQRHSTGSFPRTQDTFVGLQALARLIEIVTPERNDYWVDLTLSKKNAGVKSIKTFVIGSEDTHLQSFADIPSNTRTVSFTVGGIGFGLVSLKYEYSRDLINVANRFNLTLVKESDSSNRLELRICASFIPKTADERSDMTLVEVYFPSGYVVDNDPISAVNGTVPVKQDIRFGATSVVVYYASLGTENNCFTVTAYRRFMVSMRRPAYVLVHDFYNPEHYALQVYQTDEDL